MQEAAGRECVAQTADEVVGAVALGGADGVGVPFGGFEIVDGDEGRLAAHGQAHVLLCKIAIHHIAQGVEPRP